jgi:hypothetical protein
MRLKPLALPILALLALAAAAPAQAAPKPPKTKLDQPVLSCGTSSGASIEVQVCAGASGAPAGFSLQWLTAEAFAANGGVWLDSDDPGLCKASFSGNASGFFYSLAPGQCVTVNIGDLLFDNPGVSTNCDVPLACGTEYVFRSFAHATSGLMRSDFTGVLACSTLSCSDDPGCTFTQGYWKTHGPIPTGNNVNEWPVNSLTLGTVPYTDLELQAIFDTPAAGNGLISLAHQLIAAKLNVANGADDSSIAATIAAADALIGGLVVPPVGSGSLSNAATSTLNAALAAYNEGLTGPGHCP